MVLVKEFILLRLQDIEEVGEELNYILNQENRGSHTLDKMEKLLKDLLNEPETARVFYNPSLEERRFVDFTHDGTGKMCTMYYYPKTNKYELEPIEKNG